MKKEILKSFIVLLFFFVLNLGLSPVFAQQKPNSENGKRCEKFYRGADGKIVRQTVPCPSSK